MKRVKGVFKGSLVMGLFLSLIACKKEVPPTLFVEVVDSSGLNTGNLLVWFHDGDDTKDYKTTAEIQALRAAYNEDPDGVAELWPRGVNSTVATQASGTAVQTFEDDVNIYVKVFNVKTEEELKEGLNVDASVSKLQPLAAQNIILKTKKLRGDETNNYELTLYVGL